MNIIDLGSLVGNIGLPAVILIYMIWRLDKFLTHLCLKLDKYNDELGNIHLALRDIVELIKTANGKTNR